MTARDNGVFRTCLAASLREALSTLTTSVAFAEKSIRVSFFPGFWARAGETLYAQRELLMTGFTVVLDMTWSVALAGRKKRL